jgi:hypothetical protein
MIATRYNSSALRQSEIQKTEYRIKELNVSLIRLVHERSELKKKLQELSALMPRPEVVRRLPPPPSPSKPPVVKVRKIKAQHVRRKKVFTDEILKQIPMWIEQGLNRVQIAERIGCTGNSLQVTCSKKGISLWHKNRPRSQPVVYQYEEEAA